MQLDRIALGQGIVELVNNYANDEIDDFIDHATRVSMTNGTYMGDMKVWFSTRPGAGRNRGNMIRAMLVVIWSLTAGLMTPVNT